MNGPTGLLSKGAPRGPTAPVRRLVLALTASTALGCSLAFATAVAQPVAQAGPADRTMRFDLPSQPLGVALDTFSRQTGWQIGYASALATGRTSRPVSGTMTPERALEALLGGTGLAVRMTGPATASLVGTPAGAPGAGGALELDPVTVSAAAGAGSGGADGVATTVIGPAELARKNPTDLAGVFSGEPGIRVGSSVPMSQKVYVNGVEETNLAVTIDGSRQNNKVFHHNATTLIDPAFLKTVRVDAGVAPADAGPGALAGAIAYETKDARDLLAGDGIGAFLKSTVNSNGPTLVTSASAYGRHEGLEALGYFTFGKGDAFEAGNGQTVAGTETDLISGLVKAAVETESGDRIQFSYERVYDDASRPFRPNIGFISGRPAWEPRVRDVTLDRRNTVLTYSNTRPTDLWDPKVVLAYGRTTVDTMIFTRPRPPATEPGRYPGGGETASFNGKAENRFAFGMGTVTAGVDFYRDEATYDDETYAVGERARNIGAYAQARLEPLARARLSFGARVDRQVFEGTTGEEWTNAGVSYNVSGAYDLHPEYLTAKAGYSHTWAGIPLAENFIMNTDWDYGPDGPEPVSSDNVTLGLEARYQGFTAEGRVFRTTIDDARAARYAVSSATLDREVESRGYELSAGYRWDEGYVRVKYADIDVSIDGEPADTDLGTYLATPVGRIITVGGAHTVRAWNLTVGADVEFVLEHDDVQAGHRPLEGYEVVNLFAEYRVPAWSNLALRVDVHNLLDETYAERATYGHEFGTVTPLYQPGRSVLLTASATF